MMKIANPHASLWAFFLLAAILLLGLGTTRSASAQTGEVTGTVTDSLSGEPLPGVNVVIRGTQQGASTGAEGSYTITDVDAGEYALQASFVGYAPKTVENITVSAGETVTADFDLAPSAVALDEVVAIGYGEQERRDVTGSVSSISSQAIKEVPVTSVDRALQGQVAGVYVDGGRGKPGDEAGQVRIRGSRSITAGNDPLYVVDGIPLTGGLRDINPNDIASIEVLKDASSTAIYGARGANGVVLVTTERGYDGRTSVSYNTSLSAKQPYKEVDLFNAAEFAEYKRESRRATGTYENDEALFEPTELQGLEEGRSTDWQDLLLEGGFEQNHQLGISGGSEAVQFNVSLGALLDDGIVPQQSFNRYTTRLNLDVEVSDWLQVGTSTLGSYSVEEGNDLNPFFEAVTNNPLGAPYTEEGELNFLPTSDGLRSNPLNEVVDGALVNEETRYRLLSQLYGEADLSGLVEGLAYRLNFSPDLVQERLGDFQGRLTNARRGATPTAQRYENFDINYTIDNIVTYTNTFADVHELDLTGLFSVQTFDQDSSSISVRGIPVEDMQQYNFGAAEEILGADSDFEKWSLVSYMARANYGYDGRYLITATARLDGSSRFGDNQKYGIFPSVALAWNVDSESFMEGNEVFDALRVRLSYGQSGNTAIDPYRTLGLLGRTTYAFGSNAGFGYRPDQLSNADLKWETTSSYNLGVEFSVLNARLSGSADAYVQTTDDLLLARQLPFSSGYGSVLENIGSTRSRGVELQLSSANIVSADVGGFEWTTDFNLAYNDAEIVSLYGGEQDDVGNEWFIGEPISVFYDYEKIGIWQEDEADEAAEYGQSVGEIRVRDQNGDGQITGEDRIIVGQEQPDFTGGFNTRFSYQGFDLSVFLIGQFGNTIDSDLHNSDINDLFGRYNNLDIDYWTPDNPSNDYPRPNQNQESPRYASTMGYFSGSFVKVRNVTLAYSLPSSVVGRLGAQSLRVSLGMRQPYIFSSYVQDHKGLDPEYTGLDSPPTRSFRLSLDATL